MSEFILSFFGIICVYAGIKAIKKNLYLKKAGIRTTGTVISTRVVRSTNNRVDDTGPIRYLYRSTVKFTTKNNQTIEVELGDANAVEDAIGSERKIIYNPQFSKEVKEDSVLSMVIAPWLFFWLGLVMFIWGMLEMFGIINVIK